MPGPLERILELEREIDRLKSVEVGHPDNRNMVWPAAAFGAVSGSPTTASLGNSNYGAYAWLLGAGQIDSIGLVYPLFGGNISGSQFSYRVYWAADVASGSVVFSVAGRGLDEGDVITDAGGGSETQPQAVQAASGAVGVLSGSFNLPQVFGVDTLFEISIARVGTSGSDSASGGAYILAAWVGLET